jgi:hypothetical protein
MKILTNCIFNNPYKLNITNLNATKRDISKIRYITRLIDRMIDTTSGNKNNLNALIELKNKFIKSISFKVIFTASEQDFVNYFYNHYYKQLTN